MNETTQAQSSDILVMITTTGTRKEAQQLSRDLVDQQLVACVQLSPISSIYSWQGDIQEDDEIRLMIKLLSKHKDSVTTYLKEHHPYDTPEIISTTFYSEQDYYQWCLDVCV